MTARFSLLVLLISALTGVAAGIGGFTFVYAEGATYLSNNPEACGNCHIMGPQLSAWRHGSHRSVATCNDCHTPPGLVQKYVVKANNGFWHSYGFTTGDFHEPIQITEHNRTVTEAACRVCHQSLVDTIDGHAGGEAVSCIRCHSQVGHND